MPATITLPVAPLLLYAFAAAAATVWWLVSIRSTPQMTEARATLGVPFARSILIVVALGCGLVWPISVALRLAAMVYFSEQ